MTTTTTTPVLGDIVEYTLTEQDAAGAHKRRIDANQSQIAATNSGAMVHTGNYVEPGDKFPLIITRVWPRAGADAPHQINGQVLLDGNDTLWVTSRREGDGQGFWRPVTVNLTPGVHVPGCNPACDASGHAMLADEDPWRTCPSCSTRWTADIDACPVCPALPL